MLRVDNVRKVFESARGNYVALDGVSLEVPAGQSTKIDYQLTRPNAAIRLADGRLHSLKSGSVQCLFLRGRGAPLGGSPNRD